MMPNNSVQRTPLAVAVIALLLGVSTSCHATQQKIEGSWTGGFSLDWVAVNVRFNPPNDNSGGTADIIFPFYGGSESAINVPLGGVTQTADRLHFEVPLGARKAVFDGRHNDGTISGDFLYDGSKGSFGLTCVATVALDALEPYYGAYRVSPNRVISILRGWGHARTLNYVDYKTGQVGTLWPSSETEFFTGDGLAVSFPVTLRVSFRRDATGRVSGLSWQSKNEPNLLAQRIGFKEERITFKNGDISLGGTLVLPAVQGRFPVVIVTPADYGTNRNQLRLWAHAYVSRGIAALIFDSRGAGESTGRANSSSFSDLANDVLAGVQVLRARNDIDPAHIGLFGFSNSAFIVSLAASRSKDVSFLVLQSLVGVVPWRQESHRAETQLRVDNFPESTVTQGAEFMRLKYEVARTGTAWEQLQAIVERARGERWLAYTNPPSTLERLRQVYEATMTYDPVPALEALDIPILAIWGNKDTYLPVPESVAAFKQSMAKAGNTKTVIKIYPNCNHSLLESDSGSPSTGGTEKTFAEGLWKLKTDWVLEHVGRPK
jgi:pimeloyl-ACP methyl ester carboxylesterase